MGVLIDDASVHNKHNCCYYPPFPSENTFFFHGTTRLVVELLIQISEKPETSFSVAASSFSFVLFKDRISERWNVH